MERIRAKSHDFLDISSSLTYHRHRVAVIDLTNDGKTTQGNDDVARKQFRPRDALRTPDASRSPSPDTPPSNPSSPSLRYDRHCSPHCPMQVWTVSRCGRTLAVDRADQALCFLYLFCVRSILHLPILPQPLLSNVKRTSQLLVTSRSLSRT